MTERSPKREIIEVHIINIGSYIPVNYNIEYRFCMLDGGVCGLSVEWPVSDKAFQA